MAAIINSYPGNVYHQSSYLQSHMSPFYANQYLQQHHHHHHHRHHHHQHQPTIRKRPTQHRTSTPIRTIEPMDSNIQSLRPRRAPRIHREVIVLPTPEPIYRQVRHRLPTPERRVIQRTVIQKSNGDTIVQQERYRKKKNHSQSQSKHTANL